MSRNPFRADAAVPARLAAQDGTALRAAALPLLSGLALAAGDAARLCDRFGLGPDDLLLHLLPLAEARAQAPVSGFRVGAAGRTAAGDVLLGHNVEARGTALSHAIHAEGFVALRARARAAPLAVLAVSEAHPCAHCRQVLAELSGSEALRLVDPLGHHLSLAELYPWPFDPAYLGGAGAVPGQGSHPGLRLRDDAPPAVARALEAAGQGAHAPYSQSPAAAVVETPGGLFSGASLESVAFNPTITPLQAALVELLAAGEEPGAIRAAWLAQTAGGMVDLAPATRELLAALAPEAHLAVLAWA